MIKNSKQKVQLGLLEPKAIATFPIREGYTDSEVSERQMEYETGGVERTLEIKVAHKDKLDIVHKSKHKISVRTHFMARKPADV